MNDTSNQYYVDIVVFVCSSLLLGNTQQNDKDEEDITTRMDDTTTRMTVCLIICRRLFLGNKAMCIYQLIFMFISTIMICWTMAMAQTDSGQYFSYTIVGRTTDNMFITSLLTSIAAGTAVLRAGV